MGKTKTAFVSDIDADKNKKKHDKAHQKEEGKVHISGLKGGQRVKIVEAAPTEEAPVFEEGAVNEAQSEGKVEKKSKSSEKIRSKKYKEAKNKIDREKFYSTPEAVKLVKDSSYSKFDGTMELHLIVKKVGSSAQVALPYTAGREKRVEIADDDTIAKLKEGKIDYDILIATPEMMPKLVPFARLLGPKGLMPNPKNGTLVPDPKKAKAFSTSTVTIKTEREAPLVHAVVGKNSQKDEEIVANVEAILKALGGQKQVLKAYLKSTMSPSAKLQVA